MLQSCLTVQLRVLLSCVRFNNKLQLVQLPAATAAIASSHPTWLSNVEFNICIYLRFLQSKHKFQKRILLKCYFSKQYVRLQRSQFKNTIMVLNQIFHLPEVCNNVVT